MAKKSWRCWHCDEVFTRPQDALEHFGGSQGALAGCQIKGSDGGLLAIVREQDHELTRLRAEDSDLIRVMQTMQSEKGAAVRRSEEDGYGRGVTETLALCCSECVVKVRGELPCGCKKGESCSDCDPEGNAFPPTTEKATWLD